ncbi:DUF397 domain-containing protein [Streptomyces sp. NPDC051561]|uniref:DUF397 domain-containing protein n=1 Tax=Streptomyces sp. NPDC051561 TaxID=3365658 RepID=UPI00378CF74C
MNAEALSWFKSSYSGGEGGECLEVAYDWRKSSYSGGEGGDCLEVSPLPSAIHVRDSKLASASPELCLTPTAWATFLAHAATTATATVTA